MIDINNLGIDIEKMMKDVKGMNNTHVTFTNAGVQIKKDDISTAIQVIENDTKKIIVSLKNGKEIILDNTSFFEYQKEFNK
jgi:hypothetical protein